MVGYLSKNKDSIITTPLYSSALVSTEQWRDAIHGGGHFGLIFYVHGWNEGHDK